MDNSDTILKLQKEIERLKNSIKTKPLAFYLSF